MPYPYLQYWAQCEVLENGSRYTAILGGFGRWAHSFRAPAFAHFQGATQIKFPSARSLIRTFVGAHWILLLLPADRPICSVFPFSIPSHDPRRRDYTTHFVGSNFSELPGSFRAGFSFQDCATMPRQTRASSGPSHQSPQPTPCRLHCHWRWQL